MYMIECENLCRTYRLRGQDEKQIRVLDNLNLKIKKGEIYGLAGKNGAGKTTLIKILTTLLLPDSGKVQIGGFDVVKEEKEVRKRIGVVLSNNRALYLKLTAEENMRFFADLYFVPRKRQKGKIEEVLKAVNLWERRGEYAENFSHGMMQRLNIARVLLADPELIILDEPTNGLDIESTNELRKLIFKLNQQGKTILLTTHSLEEIEILSSRMGVLKDGKIVREGVPQVLKEQFQKKIFELSMKKETVHTYLTEIERALGTEAYIKSDGTEDSVILRLIGEPQWDMEYVLKKIKTTGVEVSQILCKAPGLEDIFFEELRREHGVDDCI